MGKRQVREPCQEGEGGEYAEEEANSAAKRRGESLQQKMTKEEGRRLQYLERLRNETCESWELAKELDEYFWENLAKEKK